MQRFHKGGPVQHVERNARCPCGSQKKFKHCCLKKTSSLPSLQENLSSQELRIMAHKILREVLEFAYNEFGGELIANALDEFYQDVALKENLSEEEKAFFCDWYLFRWIPFNYSAKWRRCGPNQTLADLYIQEHPDPETSAFLNSVAQSPFSFFLVEDVIPSKQLILKDLMLDRTIFLNEMETACQENKNRVLFTRVIFHKGRYVQLSPSPFLLPLRYAMNILDLKKLILKQEPDFTPQALLEYDNELRGFYFSLLEASSRPPKFFNQDGDPIKLCTLQYKLAGSPKEAFDQLIPLCKGEDPKNIFQDGVFDRKNELSSIQIPWLKNKSTNLIMGNIKIEGDSLSVFVNSEKRSKQIQKEIEKRLPSARLEVLSIETLERACKTPTKPHPKPTLEQQQRLQAYYRDYYSKWLNTPLPILNDKTPRQAVTIPEEKEKLELLLLDFEFNNEHQESYEQIDVSDLRAKLNLPKKVQPQE